MTSKKFQESAEQEEFLRYLAEKTGAKNQEDLEKVISRLGDDGLKKAYAQFVQERQARKASFGAKLNYIRQLRGLCPTGMRMEYYKSGGKVCRKCVEEKAGGPIESFKCGRKCPSGKRSGKWSPKKGK